MSQSIDFRIEAKADLLDAIRWYNEQRSGLGEEFEEAVNEALDRVLNAPEMYAIAFRDVRRVLVHRFPYIIYYSIEEDTILVFAVFHGHRDQETVRRRVDD